VNLNRFVALGILATEGPLHGHAVRRRAEAASVQRWGGVNPGALSRELRQLAANGLIEAVRSEHQDRRPARTIYQVTTEGHQELAVLRDQALRDTRVVTDPVGVALLFGGRADPAELAEALGYRRQLLAAALERLRAEHQRLAGVLDARAAAVFSRGEYLLAAECDWNQQAEKLLSAEAPGAVAGRP
jgi:DNA-binding PadR family transcriptional regulator